MPDHIVQAENVVPLSFAQREDYLFLLCHMTHVLKIAFFVLHLVPKRVKGFN